ncbi:MAG TPA: hypothetical protein VMS21_07740, partial [Methylomirabilota bacterium]|nr:hypothetical protein [Methylomirabilota bacterium]
MDSKKRAESLEEVFVSTGAKNACSSFSQAVSPGILALDGSQRAVQGENPASLAVFRFACSTPSARY